MTSPRHLSPALALGVAAGGIGLFSVMDAFMKLLVLAIGVYNALLWRTLLQSAIGGVAWRAGGGRRIGARALRLHLARGTLTTAMALLFFWGLARVPMAQGVALTFLAPLIALFLAGLTLGERIRRAAIGGSLVASLGVLIIAAGQVQAHASDAVVMGSVAILAASVIYAVSLILLRQQAQAADPLEVALFTSVVLSGLLLFAAPWFGVLPTSDQLPVVFGAAALGSVSAVALAWAYGRAEAQVLAPTEYTAFVWSALFGWLAFAERVSPYTVAGALFIIAGCLVAIRKPVPGPQTEAAL